MTRRLATTAMLVLVGLFAVGIWLPSETPADPIDRLFSGFKSTSSEISTSDDTTGVEAFSRTIFVQGDVNTLFVTFSGTGDSHDGAASRLDCFIDGVECNSTFGKIRLQRHSAQIEDSDGDDVFNSDGEDLHDNGIYYTWCAPITHGPHTVKLVLTSDSSGKSVFIERYFVYIDAQFIGAGANCVSFDPSD